MSKRVLRFVSMLFLSSILVLSCSNANKTGSGNNDSGNGGSGIDDGGTGTGGDGGTTQTPEGIAKYAGTWTAKFTDSSGGINTYYIIIGNDGNVKTKDDVSGEKAVENIMDLGNNTFSMTVYHSSSITADVTIVFIDSNSGTINDDAIGNGVIRKQNNGNKGLWYYEGTWILTPTQKQGEANMTMEIKKDGTIDLKIGNQTQLITDIVDKGKEKYEGKFTPESEKDQQTLTLSFSGDDTGTFSLSIPNKDVINGSMEKQKQQ